MLLRVCLYSGTTREVTFLKVPPKNLLEYNLLTLGTGCIIGASVNEPPPCDVAGASVYVRTFVLDLISCRMG